jgi:folate-binding Fe-S cluster repair protein YgfZ
MADASFVFLDDRGILAVSGPDRRPFLQGLVSNDVDKVGPAAARYAAFLTAQGKYLHDFMMVEAGESIWLDAEAARLGDLKRRLSMYRLRAKASLDERSDLCVAAVFGADAPAALGLSREPGAARPLGSGAVFVDPRLASLGARAILPREEARALLTDAGLVEARQEAADAGADPGADPSTGNYRNHGWARDRRNAVEPRRTRSGAAADRTGARGQDARSGRSKSRPGQTRLDAPGKRSFALDPAPPRFTQGPVFTGSCWTKR